MKSYPDSERVLEELGDKVLEAFSEATSETRADLAQYRQDSPEFVVDASPRGLANWIHDRLMKQTFQPTLEGLFEVRLILGY